MPVYYGIKDLTGDEASLSRLGNNLVDGLSNGAIWALVAIGYTLVYGIVELINFAHGEVFMIGSFVAAGFFGTIGLTQDTARACSSSACSSACPSACSPRGAEHHDRARRLQAVAQRAQARALITAVGFSFILQNVGLLWLGGSQGDHRPDPLAERADHRRGIEITNGDVLAIVVTIPLLLA